MAPGRSRARRAPADVLGPPGNTDHELAAPSALAMAQAVTSMPLPRGRLECAAAVRVRAPPLAVRAAALVRADDAGVLHDSGGVVRSDERRVGKECARRLRYRWTLHH